MKKKWLQGINMLLGALSVSLLGCKSTHECLYGPPPEPEKYGCPEEMVQAMYGVPEYMNGADTMPQPVPAPEPPMLKYGVPYVEEKGVKVVEEE